MIVEADVDEVVEEDALDAAEEVVDEISISTTMVNKDTLLTTTGYQAVATNDKTVTRTKNFQGCVIKLYADYPTVTTYEPDNPR